MTDTARDSAIAQQAVWRDLNDGHRLLWDPGANREWPFSLWVGDEKLAAYTNADALIDDIEYRDDVALAEGEFGEIMDWARMGRGRSERNAKERRAVGRLSLESYRGLQSRV